MTALHTPRQARRMLDAAEAREWAERIGRHLLAMVEAQLIGAVDMACVTRWRALYRNAVMVARKYEAYAH